MKPQWSLQWLFADLTRAPQGGLYRTRTLNQLGRVYSVRICLDAIGLLVGAAVAVAVLDRVPVMAAIAGSGVFVIAVSLVGLWRVGAVQSR